MGDSNHVDQRPLGNTGLMVSPIGFGAFKIGRNEQIKYPTAYDLPDMQQVRHLFDRILEMGINYIDTAPAYGLSEERIGQTLAARRNEFVLSTKIGEVFENGQSSYCFTGEFARQSMAESLRSLQCEQVDILFVHSDGNDVANQTDTDLIPALQQLKAEGKTRFIGFSGKMPEGATEALGWADVLMVEYNLDNQSHADVIAEAGKRGIGIVCKKALGSGWLKPDEAIEFVLSNPDVQSIVIGGLNADHMAANVAVASRIQSG